MVVYSSCHIEAREACQYCQSNIITMGRCVFNPQWLEADPYKDWLKCAATNKYEAYCRVCSKTFQLGTMGVKALDSHMGSVKHKKNYGLQRNRLKMKGYGIMDSYLVNSEKNQTPTTIPTSCSTSKPDTMRTAFGSTDSLKAEIIWTLRTVVCHQSYNSNDGIQSIFQLMFTDSHVVRIRQPICQNSD